MNKDRGSEKLERTDRLEQAATQESTIARFLGRLLAPFRYDPILDGYWPVRTDGSIVHLSPATRGPALPPGGEKIVADMIRDELREGNDEALGDVD